MIMWHRVLPGLWNQVLKVGQEGLWSYLLHIVVGAL